MRKPPAPRTLFVLKKRATSYDGDPYSYGTALKSSGLLNSARFVHAMLLSYGRDSKLVQVVDNNDIDREVTSYHPDTVIIEAFWVVPSKFDVLRRLHPTVHWIIRSHSEIPFAAGEGTTMPWFFDYMRQANVSVAFNTERTTDEFRDLLALSNPTLSACMVRAKVMFLPNYYPVAPRPLPRPRATPGVLRVGCFGAIRPLKNQLIQAVAAIAYAASAHLELEFHVNGTRVEGNASNQKKNLVALFAGLNSQQFRLVEHPWLPHDEFLTLVRTMDIGLQVSFNESFNIVTADAVNVGIPVVVSSEIEWVSPKFYASCTSSEDIVRTMRRALRHQRWLAPLYDVNRSRLKHYSDVAKVHWLYWT